jgi:hypothetical protein
VYALPETSYEIKIYTDLGIYDLFPGLLHGYLWQKSIPMQQKNPEGSECNRASA